MPHHHQPVTQLRLAEVLAALSLVADLGMGQAPELSVATCLVATRLAQRMGLTTDETSAVYYTTLLRFIGCTAYAHEDAQTSAGEDVAMRAAGAYRDFGTLSDMAAFLLFDLARDAPFVQRAGAVVRTLAQGQRATDAMFAAHCEVAIMVALRLGLGAPVEQGLRHAFERWDGKGSPQRLRRAALMLPARVAQVAYRGLLFYRLGGTEAARAAVQQSAGGALDPEIATAFLSYGAEILAELASVDACLAVVAVEPQPHQWISAVRLDEALGAFADLTDLKVPCLRGHSRGVAEITAAAARLLGFSEDEEDTVRRAALLHDLGRAGIANRIWEKPASLTVSEWEQVRLHAYHTERILSCSRVLAPLAPLAGMHHERLDGSGYHRQATAATIPLAARLLAAADAYQAMTQARPYRPARSADETARELLTDVKKGRHDGAAVHAVLAAAGAATAGRRRTWPAALSDREVAVLVLITRGATTKQVAAQLHISPKTVGHHVQHIYAKIGVSTRAGAAMFAMEHGLMAGTEPPAGIG